jgi:hypothetical protein
MTPSARKLLRRYLFNHSNSVALVHRHRSDIYWPMRLTQLVGGRRWSLAVIVYETAHPTSK